MWARRAWCCAVRERKSSREGGTSTNTFVTHGLSKVVITHTDLPVARSAEGILQVGRLPDVQTDSTDLRVGALEALRRRLVHLAHTYLTLALPAVTVERLASWEVEAAVLTLDIRGRLVQHRAVPRLESQA